VSQLKRRLVCWATSLNS